MALYLRCLRTQHINDIKINSDWLHLGNDNNILKLTIYLFVKFMCHSCLPGGLKLKESF